MQIEEVQGWARGGSFFEDTFHRKKCNYSEHVSVKSWADMCPLHAATCYFLVQRLWHQAIHNENQWITRPWLPGSPVFSARSCAWETFCTTYLLNQKTFEQEAAVTHCSYTLFTPCFLYRCLCTLTNFYTRNLPQKTFTPKTFEYFWLSMNFDTINVWTKNLYTRNLSHQNTFAPCTLHTEKPFAPKACQKPFTPENLPTTSCMENAKALCSGHLSEAHQSS